MEPVLSPESLGVRADLGSIQIEERFLVSLALIAGVQLLRWLLIRLVRSRSEVIRDWQRRAILAIRTVATALILLGLLVLWAPELESFMFSIAAFLVAIVIATKELILCLSGGVVRGASGAFTIGDWIEVGAHSGEVVEIDAVSTQLQEFDRVEFEYTGRVITLPNSLFLTTPVINHSFRKRYIFHEFVITSEPVPDALRVRGAIEAEVRRASADFAEVASRYRTMIQKRTGIELPDPGPWVRIRTTDFAKLRFEVRLFCPRALSGDMEQAAMQAYLEATSAHQPLRAPG